MFLCVQILHLCVFVFLFQVCVARDAPLTTLNNGKETGIFPPHTHTQNIQNTHTHTHKHHNTPQKKHTTTTTTHTPPHTHHHTHTHTHTIHNAFVLNLSG